MTYTIRPVRPTDLAAVTEVEAICFPAAEAAAEESFKARIAAFPECFFVAEADGKIIGFINGCATDSKTIYDEMYENSACHRPDGAYQSIFGLDVIPDYRCQGIAAALMDHMIEDAKNKGRKGLILTCKDRLIHYYAKFGYKNMGISKSVHGGAVWYDMILEFGVIFLHALFLTAALLPANIIPDVPVQLLQTAALFLNILFLHKDNAYENGILMGDRPDLGHLPEE